MTGAISRAVVRRQVHFLENHGLAYLANPKCASSSIKLALRRLAGETNIGKIHRRAEASFVNNILDTRTYDSARLERATVFSAVRNPYRRALSAYLDKVRQLSPPWQLVCAEVGMEPQIVPFRDFLEILSGLPPLRTDIHFRPQWINVLYPTRGAIMLKLEDPDGMTRFFHGHGIEWPVVANRTNSPALRLQEHYDAETEALARRIYADDFRHFGYSLALELADHPGEPAVIPSDASGLADRITYWRSRRRNGQPAESPA